MSYQKEEVEQDPFGEEFTQAWPVTPYKVRVSNRTAERRWVRVSVDGEPAYGGSLKAGEARVIAGKQAKAGRSSSAVHELLFARPRLVRAGEDAAAPADPARALEYESIRVDVHACSRGAKSRGTKRGATAGYAGVNKAQCKKAKAGAMTRTGDELAPAAAGPRTSRHYDVGAVVASLRVRYGQRAALERAGVWTDAKVEAGDAAK